MGWFDANWAVIWNASADITTYVAGTLLATFVIIQCQGRDAAAKRRTWLVGLAGTLLIPFVLVCFPALRCLPSWAEMEQLTVRVLADWGYESPKLFPFRTNGSYASIPRLTPRPPLVEVLELPERTSTL